MQYKTPQGIPMSVEELVQTLSGCNDAEATAAAKLICTDRNAIAPLAAYCAANFSIVLTGAGLVVGGADLVAGSGVIAAGTAGAGAPVSYLGAATGVATMALGLELMKKTPVKQFCGAVVQQVRRVGASQLKVEDPIIDLFLATQPSSEP